MSKMHYFSYKFSKTKLNFKNSYDVITITSPKNVTIFSNLGPFQSKFPATPVQ